MSTALKNDLLLRALLREPTPRRPVWLMRQAGRSLPEYKKARNTMLAIFGGAYKPVYSQDIPASTPGN